MEIVKKASELVLIFVNEAERKSRQPIRRILILGFMAGLYIAFGAQGALTVTAETAATLPALSKLLSASVFPVGLMLVVLAGGELFTGDCLIFAGPYHGKLSLKKTSRFLLWVLIGNLLGSLFFVGIVWGSNMLTPPILKSLTTMAATKTGLPFHTLFLRGVGCNIIVAAAVWICYAAQSFIGKIFACWFPIMLFVLLGFEHIVANFYYLPLALVAGVTTDYLGILKNFVAVLLGNTLAGALVISGLYTWAYAEQRD